MEDFAELRSIFSGLKSGIDCLEQKTFNDLTLKKYDVEIGSFIKHEGGEFDGVVGIVLYALHGRLFVKYLNYKHTGYEISSPFKKVTWDWIVENIDFK